MTRAERFIEDGFVRIPQAFPRALADACRARLWKDTGCDPDDPSTWTRPVIRLWDYAEPEFRAAANTPALHEAFDELVGPGRWLRRGSLGTFPIRFPHPDDPGDAGWHCDASYEGPGRNWYLNVASKGRALLMLFLFSDVGEDDAPTRIRVGSHLDVPPVLAPYGEAGADFMTLAAAIGDAAHRPLALATGQAGDVYLCHPFLVHAAQPHRGRTPKFMAQPPLLPREPIALDRADGAYSPVEIAIRRALASSG